MYLFYIHSIIVNLKSVSVIRYSGLFLPNKLNQSLYPNELHHFILPFLFYFYSLQIYELVLKVALRNTMLEKRLFSHENQP